MTTLLLQLWVVMAIAAPPTDLTVTAPANSTGLTLELAWTAATDDGNGTDGYVVLRSTEGASGPWTVLRAVPAGTTSVSDTVTTDPEESPPEDEYWYQVVSRPDGVLPTEDPADWTGPGASVAVAGSPSGSWVNLSPGHLHLLLLILVFGGLMALFTRQAQRGAKTFIRRIPGIDAIEEGIGRATEMGQPVLYVPGIDELQDIQTIASMLILGQVSQTVAEYEADIVVTCCIPIVREVADEVVRAGYFQAGHPDAYDPTSVRFISSEQFAFAAGTNGIMLREKPATNIFLGRFFAESLLLAETGYVNQSIQIAGTAEASQLPFFVAACDYTLIGEELYAVSAYLSGDPRLVSSLKASDYVKIYVVVMLTLGTMAATALHTDFFLVLFSPVGG